MNVDTKPHIPRQSDRSSELAELAALASAISDHVDRRQRGDRQADAASANSQATRPVSGDSRPRRRMLLGVVVSAVAVVAAVTAVLISHGPAARTTISSGRSAAAPPAVVSGSDATPSHVASALGTVAGRRIGRGGRPVSVFACQAAYDADVVTANGALPTPGLGTAAYDAYVHACLSDIS